MVYARYRKTGKTEWRRLTITRSVLGLIALGGLAIGSLALPLLTEASHDRALNTRRDRLEKGIRLRERAPAANSNKMAMNASPAAMLVSITVDRTDDTAAASACTAAANDCSLRGAVSFANANPGTTIIVPAGTYQLTISGAGEGFSGNNAIGDLDITANNTAISWLRFTVTSMVFFGPVVIRSNRSVPGASLFSGSASEAGLQNQRTG